MWGSRGGVPEGGGVAADRMDPKRRKTAEAGRAGSFQTKFSDLTLPAAQPRSALRNGKTARESRVRQASTDSEVRNTRARVPNPRIKALHHFRAPSTRSDLQSLDPFGHVNMKPWKHVPLDFENMEIMSTL